MQEADARFYRRVFGLATAAILGLTLFQLLQPFLGIILWAFLLAFFLQPTNRRVRGALGGRRGRSALLLTLAVLLLVVVPTLLIGFLFIGQAAELIAYLQQVAGRLRESGQPGPIWAAPLAALEERFGHLVPFPADQIQAWVVDALKRLLQFLVSAGGSLFFGALGAAVGLLLLLFFLFFFLRDGDEIVARCMRLVPMDPTRKARLLEHLAAVMQAVVLATLLTALAQGTLLGVGFAILGLFSPVVVGVLGVVAALVPVFGTALIWVPTAAVLAFQERWGAAIFLAAWGIVIISAADNLIRPLFISGRARLSLFPVFVGLAGGLAAFGPIGMFLGPIIVALGMALFQFAEESLSDPGVPDPPG